jgi:hypothetical protein
MAELFGKAGGVVGGRGGSMHLFDASKRFLGGWAIVGGHIPIAAGVAFASKYRDEPDVTLCFFGDGTANMGAFHEGLALAGSGSSRRLHLREQHVRDGHAALPDAVGRGRLRPREGLSRSKRTS